MKEQIEEMTKDLCDIECKGMKCDECDGYACEYRMLAEALYNAGYRKQEWISVEDRLPEETGEYLIIDKSGVMYLAPYSSRYRAFNATDEDDGDRWRIKDTTHWMPLPEPPKMKGGAE